MITPVKCKSILIKLVHNGSKWLYLEQFNQIKYVSQKAVTKKKNLN